MKKVMFSIIAAAFVIMSVGSCKKCGYCEYPNNGGNSSSVCKNNSFGGVLDEYAEAESNCQASNGKWVVTN